MKTKTIILWIIAFGLVSLRFLRLDFDAAANNISGITTWDEPYYTFSAMYDLIFSKPGFPAELKANMTFEVINLHSSIFSKIGFFLLGNTMEGLRLGPVIVSLFTILVLFQVLKKTFIVFDNNVISYKWLGLFILLTEPTFFMFSRAQTPQIYSIFWISILLYFVFQYTDTKKIIWLVLASIISVLVVLWVYPYNIYVSISLAAFVILVAYENKSWKIIFYAISGVISGFIVYLFMLKTYGFGLDDYITFMKSYRSWRNESDLSNRTVLSVILSPLQILYTNLLRYNPMFFVLLIAMPLIVIKKANKGLFDKFLILVLFFAFIQAFGISSYPFKKWVTLFPVLFLSLPMLSNIINSTYDCRVLRRYIFYIFYIFYILVMLILYKIQSIINSHEYWSGFDEWFIYQKPGILIEHGVLIFTFLSIVFFELTSYYKIKRSIFCIYLILFQFALMLRTSFINQTDSFNSFTKKYSTYLNDKIILSNSEIYTLNSGAIVLYYYNSKELNFDKDIIKRADEYTGRKRVVIKSYVPNHPLPTQEKWGDSTYLLKYTFEDSVYSFAIYE